MAELMYTLNASNPELIGLRDDYDQLKSYNTMLDTLSVHGKHQFANVLLSTFRFAMSYIEYNQKKSNKVHDSIAKEFINVEFNDVLDSDELYLVERLIAEDFDIYLRPLRTLNLDVRVLKAVIVRNMFQGAMDMNDINVICSSYNLQDYLHCVSVGGAETTGRVEVINLYFKYLYEYYKRSDNYVEETLAGYKEYSEVKRTGYVYGRQQDIIDINLYLSLQQPKEQTLANIEEYCNNIKFYANRLYEINFSPDNFESSCGIGNASPSVKFTMLDRCLIIYDLFSAVVGPDGSIDDLSLNPKIDRIAKHELVKKCPDLVKKGHLDLRKEVRKGYKNALRLIEESTQGYLTI